MMIFLMMIANILMMIANIFDNDCKYFWWWLLIFFGDDCKYFWWWLLIFFDDDCKYFWWWLQNFLMMIATQVGSRPKRMHWRGWWRSLAKKHSHHRIHLSLKSSYPSFSSPSWQVFISIIIVIIKAILDVIITIIIIIITSPKPVFCRPLLEWIVSLCA